MRSSDQGRPAPVAGEVKRLGLVQRVAALRLAKVAPGDLRLAGLRIDKLDDARARDALTDALRHRLDHQPQRRLFRRAFGLA